MKRLFIIIIVLGLLFSCSTLRKADDIVISGQAEKVIFNIEYTDTERASIQKGLARYNQFHDRWKGFIENPVQLSALGNDKLMADYQDIKNIYLTIEYIISLNFHRYNKETQSELLRLQKMAYDYDDVFGRVKTVSDVSAYAAIVAQIATKML